jgi:hypothetical protein
VTLISPVSIPLPDGSTLMVRMTPRPDGGLTVQVDLVGGDWSPAERLVAEADMSAALARMIAATARGERGSA